MDWTVIFAFALGGAFVYCANIYGWYKLLGKEIDFKDYRNYLALVVLVLIGTILNCAFVTFLKMLLMMILLFLINYLLVSKRLVKTFVTVTIVQGITMIAELIVALIASIFINNYSDLFMKEPIGILVLNLGVAIVLLISMEFKVFTRISNYLIHLFENVKQNHLIICCFATVILAITFMVMSYTQLPKVVMLFINSTLVVIYIGIVIGLVSSQEKIRKINNKYETSLTSLREYEDIMDKYRVDNHENKNQLLTIRNMIKAKDKTTVKYIDKLVDNKIKDNENIFYTTSKIPEGGLRATIYSKLCKMKDANIDYTLDIANDVRTVDLIKLGDDTTLNICKIIGVFLDNAIEAVEQLDEKDIIVEIFVMDNDLYIEISNNYDGEIALEKISNKGYTTKGKGHGYGLSLVREIIKNDHNLENGKKIDREMFTQSLKIKM